MQGEFVRRRAYRRQPRLAPQARGPPAPHLVDRSLAIGVCFATSPTEGSAPAPYTGRSETG